MVAPGLSYGQISISAHPRSPPKNVSTPPTCSSSHLPSISADSGGLRSSPCRVPSARRSRKTCRSVPLADDLRARSSSGRKCALRAEVSGRLATFALQWTPCRARARAAIPRRTASAATRRSAASVPERGRTLGFGGSGQRRGAVERAGPRTTRGSLCGILETAVASHSAYRGTSRALPACPLASSR